MRIESIEIDGVKGVRDRFRPEHLTMLHGPNGSGKSARLLTWMFGAYGYTPAGKTLESVAAVSPAGTGMRVRIKLSDGFGWERAISRDPKKGTLRQELTLDGYERLGIEEAEEKIREHIGGFTANVNLAEFTSLKADARRQFILHLCGDADGADVYVMLTRLELAVLAEVLGAGEVRTFCVASLGKEPEDLDETECRSVCEKLWKTVSNPAIRDEWLKVRDRLEADLAADDAPQTLLAWADAVKELRSAHKAARDQANAASRRLTEDKNKLVVSAEHMQVLEARHAELEAQIRQADEEIGSCAGRARMIDTAKRAAEHAQVRLVRAEKDLAQARGYLENRQWADEINALRTQAENLDADEDRRAELTKACDELDERRRSLAEQRRHAQADLAAATTDERSLAAALNKAANELSLAEHKLHACTGDAWLKASSLVQDLAEHVTEAGQDTYGELKDLVDSKCEVRAEIERLEFEIETIRPEMDTTRKQLDSTVAHIDTLRSKLAEIDESIAHADAAFARANADRNRIVDVIHEAGALRSQADQVAKDWETAKLEVSHRREVSDDARRDHAAAAAQLEQARKDAGDGGDNVDALGQARAALVEQLAGVKREIADKTKLASLERELNSCIASAAQEAVAFDVATAAQQAVKVLRETLLAGLVRPLLGRIDEFLAAANLPYRSYCDLETARGKAVFDLGWVVEDGGIDRKVSLDTLSDGETALFGAGLAYALTSLSGNPLRVMLFEADALDDVMLSAFTRALAALRDNFDHVIAARWGRGTPGSAWSVVNLEADHAAAAAA